LKKKFNDHRKKSLNPGEVSGALHFFTQDPAPADLVVAKDGTEILRSTSQEFRAVLSANPDITNAYIAFLNRKVRKGMNVIAQVANPDSGKVRVAFFDAKPYMKEAFTKINKNTKYQFAITWLDVKLSQESAMLASGHQVVCVFVNDKVNAAVVDSLKSSGVELVALRCAGYDNVDLKKVIEAGLSITRVPAYSPYAVAEFAIGLMLTLNRKYHKACQRVKDFNFSLNGLVGFDMRGKTVGVFGTGKIGFFTIEILFGFGCKVLAVDLYQNEDLKKKGVKYVEKDELLSKSDIITIHAPLLDSTKHWLDGPALAKCKPGVMIVNTSRGPLIDTEALLEAILSGKVGSAGLDVLEGEDQFFFENMENESIKNNTLVRLIACHNVVITSHQAFLTQEALENIADSTLSSVAEFATGKRGDKLTNTVKQEYK